MAKPLPIPPIPAPPLEHMDRDEMQRETLERTRRQDKFLFGDGSENAPGLVVRVDRIETTLKWFVRGLTAIGGAILTWAIAQLPSFLHGGPPKPP